MNTRKLLILILLPLFLVSCGSAKKRLGASETGAASTTKIIENAKAFLGTPYKFGGTTRKGMDCSGLVYTAFAKEDIQIPRISREMSLKGSRLYLREVQAGDLLFFETDKNRKVINHVGLVVKSEADDIQFIHSSTSQGVIISSLNNSYWREHFVMARRVL